MKRQNEYISSPAILRFDSAACGNRIKELRILKDMTQEQFAEKLHIYSKYVSRIESGRSTASIELLLKIAELFQVSMDFLLLGKTQLSQDAKSQLQTVITILQQIDKSL